MKSSLVFLIIGTIFMISCGSNTSKKNITKTEVEVEAKSNALSQKPFPQAKNIKYADGVIKPNHISQDELNQTVAKHYDSWKKKFIKTVSDVEPKEYIVAYNSKWETVSEAHGYGMVITALMAGHDPEAQKIFDGMFRLSRRFQSQFNSDLMSWKIAGEVTKEGTIEKLDIVEGNSNATDGDMDIAYGLLLADKQWGSQGSINYKNEAIKIIKVIMEANVNKTYFNINVGDWTPGPKKDEYTRPSDFMLGHLKAFKNADVENADKWQKVIDRINEIVNYQHTNGPSKETGLMADFLAKNRKEEIWLPVKGKWLESENDGDYGWNSCRTPWRLSTDFITTGDKTIIEALGKTNKWIKKSTKGNPLNVKGSYFVTNDENGKAIETYYSLSFAAPFAASAMIDSSNQEWLNSLWDVMKDGNEIYFDSTINMQVLLLVSGNWWTP